MTKETDEQTGLGENFAGQSGSSAITLDQINSAQDNPADYEILLARALLSNPHAAVLFSNANLFTDEKTKHVKLHNALFSALRELDPQNNVPDISDRDIIDDENLCTEMINHAARIIDERSDLALPKNLHDEATHTYRDMVAMGGRNSIEAIKQLRSQMDEELDHEISGMVGILEDSIAPEIFGEEEDLTCFAGKLLALVERPQDQGKKYRNQARAVKAIRSAIRAKIMHNNPKEPDDKKLGDLIRTLDIIQEKIPESIIKEMSLDNE